MINPCQHCKTANLAWATHCDQCGRALEATLLTREGLDQETLNRATQRAQATRQAHAVPRQQTNQLQDVDIDQGELRAGSVHFTGVLCLIEATRGIS